MGNWRNLSKYLTFLFFIIVAFNHCGLAQTDSNLNGSTSLLGQTGGPEVVGIHVNQNISSRVSINAGLGLLLAAHLGTNIYFTNRAKKRTSFYIGAQLSNVVAVNVFGSSNERQFGIYVPVGFEYISLKGFTAQIDVGPNFVGEDYDQFNTVPFFGSLKFGYTFRKNQ